MQNKIKITKVWKCTDPVNEETPSGTDCCDIVVLYYEEDLDHKTENGRGKGSLRYPVRPSLESCNGNLAEYERFDKEYDDEVMKRHLSESSWYSRENKIARGRQ